MSETCLYLLDGISQSNESLSTLEGSTLVLTCIPNSLITSSWTLNATQSKNTFTPGLLVDADEIWILTASQMVFFMQFGLTMIEAGAVRAPNLPFILCKNILSVCCVIIGWYAFGFTFAFGCKDEEFAVAHGDSTDSNEHASHWFLGSTDNMVLKRVSDDEYPFWFFHFTVASVTVSIVAGGMLERCTMITYICYSFLLSMWVYPTVVHWIWDQNGWLSPFNTHDNKFIKGGAIDFAGAGVVHMVAGFTALIGCIQLGPRLGRFRATSRSRNNSNDRGNTFVARMEESNIGNGRAFQVFGMFLTWFGIFGLHLGRTGTIGHGMIVVASKIAVNTAFSGSMGGVAGLLLSYRLESSWTIERIRSGVICGLVSISGCCAFVSIPDSMIIGVLGACVYYASSRLMEHVLKIDDPMDTFAVHGMCGLWAMLASGFWASKTGLKNAGYHDEHLLDATVGYRFSIQLLACVVIIVWVVSNMGLLFFTLKVFRLLRIPLIVEETGLESAENGVFGIFYIDQVEALPAPRNFGIEEEVPSRSQAPTRSRAGTESHLSACSPVTGSYQQRIRTASPSISKQITPLDEHQQIQTQVPKVIVLSKMSPIPSA